MTANGQRSSNEDASQRKPEPRPSYREDAIKTEELRIERKAFIFSLRENSRGRFLRITEDVKGRRDSIIVPAPGLDDFRKMLEEMVKVSADAPLKRAKSPEGDVSAQAV